MHKAAYYHTLNHQKVKCDLCPAACIIEPGKSGLCHVRKNVEGTLYAQTYGYVTALHEDPIEKKPLYHFYPGRPVLSAGSAGCNLHCIFCQNWDISQLPPEELPLRSLSPEALVANAMDVPGNIGIAYTYNEPSIWFEYVLDTARLAHDNGLKNILVSNGYINRQPLQEWLPFIDAVNIDLKSYDDHFYRHYAKARRAPVLETLLTIKEYGIHIEITYLVVPEANDEPEAFGKMCRWISDTLGSTTVLHLSRFFPAWKMQTYPTPPETLQKLLHIARKYLDYVYAGNIDLGTGRDTICPKCNSTLIRRHGYYTELTGLDPHGNCSNCQHHVLDYI